MKSLILLLAWPFLSSSIVGVYKRHRQICTAVNVFDRNWILTLNKDSTFAFQKNDINTKLENKHSSSEDRGTWNVSKDTLKLHFYGIHDRSYIIKKKTLTPVVIETEDIGEYSITLDYLEKE